MGKESVQEISVPSPQVFPESKTTLKNKALFLKK